MAVKRIRDEAEYKSGGNSDFIGLDEGEKFLGHFLGTADPKIDDPAFFPYKMHWNGKTSVPCDDTDCIYCADGDKPRSKAYTLWLVTIDEAGKKLGKPAGSGELRIFDMPVTVIKQFNEMRSEGDKVQGKMFRVSRPDEKTYVLVPKETKPLSKTQINELVKSDDAPDFEQMLTNKLKKAMEGTAVQRALEDDDDEPAAKSGDKAGKKGGKGKGKAAKEEPETGEWPDEGLDEVTVTVSEATEDDGNSIEVTHEDYEGAVKVWTTDDIDFDLSDLSEGGEVTITTGAKDDDGEYVLTAEPEVAGGAKKDDDDAPEDIEDETFELLKVSKAKKTIVVEHNGDELELVGGDDIDLEGWKKGHMAVVSAEYDADEETWELTAIAEPEEEAEPAKDGDDLPDEIEGAEMEVTEVDEPNSTIDVKDEEYEFTLYFLDTMKVDFDDFSVGDKITVTAEKDRSGDLVATEIPEKVGGKKGGKKGGKAAPAKKGGKGKGKGK